MPAVVRFFSTRNSANSEVVATLISKKAIFLEILELICRWEELSLGYTDSNGHPALREEITKLYETVKAENVLVLVPQEAIQIASRQACVNLSLSVDPRL